MTANTLDTAITNIWNRLTRRTLKAVASRNYEKPGAERAFWRFTEDNGKSDLSSFHGIL